MKRVRRMRVWAKTIAMVSATSVVVAACGSSGGKSKTDGSSGKQLANVSIGIFVGGAQGILIYTAQAEGIFAQYGVNATFVNSTSAQFGTAAVVGGSIDMNDDSEAALFPAIQKGEDLTALLTSTGLPVQIIARKDLPLPHKDQPFPAVLKDLAGKTVGVTALGGTFTNTVMRAVLQKAGLDPDSVHYVAVGGPATEATALKTGHVDAVVAVVPAQQLIGEGNYQMVADFINDPSTIPFPGIGPTTGNVLMAKTSYVKSHKETVDNVCRAIWKTYDFVKDPGNQAKVVADMARLTGLDPTEAAATWKTVAPTINPHLDEAQWKAVAAFAPGYKFGEPPPYVPSYADHVYAPCTTSLSLATSMGPG